MQPGTIPPPAAVGVRPLAPGGAVRPPTPGAVLPGQVRPPLAPAPTPAPGSLQPVAANKATPPATTSTPTPPPGQAAVRPTPRPTAVPKPPGAKPIARPPAQPNPSIARPSPPLQAGAVRPLNGLAQAGQAKVGPSNAAGVRPMRPNGVPLSGAAVRPRPQAALPGGKPPLPAETLRILAQLAAATGASANSAPGGPSIAPGATALLQYLQRVGQNADMSVATKILATGVIPPSALSGAGATGGQPARPLGSAARVGAMPARPVRPAATQPKVGIGGGTTPMAAHHAAKPASTSGGLTPLPSSFSGELSPLPGRPSPSLLGKRPLESSPVPGNGDPKKQKVA
jgi:hypothetical protein